MRTALLVAADGGTKRGVRASRPANTTSTVRHRRLSVDRHELVRPALGSAVVDDDAYPILDLELVRRCRPPMGGVIELVSAVDTSKPLAAPSVRQGRLGGMYALVFSARDVGRVCGRFADAGFVAPGAPPNEATIFGARFLID